MHVCADELEEIRKVTLSQVLCQTTAIREIQMDAFRVPSQEYVILFVCLPVSFPSVCVFIYLPLLSSVSSFLCLLDYLSASSCIPFFVLSLRYLYFRLSVSFVFLRLSVPLFVCLFRLSIHLSLSPPPPHFFISLFIQ